MNPLPSNEDNSVRPEGINALEADEGCAGSSSGVGEVPKGNVEVPVGLEDVHEEQVTRKPKVGRIPRTPTKKEDLAFESCERWCKAEHADSHCVACACTQLRARAVQFFMRG